MNTCNMSAPEYLFGSLFLLSNKLQLLGDAYLEQITMKQWLLLAVIHSLENPQPSVTQVAAAMGSTRQNVRKMLELLASKGYVELSENPQDKRSLSVALTPQTHKFFKDFDARGTLFLENLFKGIPLELLESSRQTYEIMFQNIERMECGYEKNSSHL